MIDAVAFILHLLNIIANVAAHIVYLNYKRVIQAVAFPWPPHKFPLLNTYKNGSYAALMGTQDAFSVALVEHAHNG